MYGMYVYVCIYTYVCVYVCMHVCVYVCMYFFNTVYCLLHYLHCSGNTTSLVHLFSIVIFVTEISFTQRVTPQMILN